MNSTTQMVRRGGYRRVAQQPVEVVLELQERE